MSPFSWDELSPARRVSWAEQYDAQHDPAQESKVSVAFEWTASRIELLEEREEVQGLRPNLPSEHAKKREELTRIDAEVQALEAVWRNTFQGAPTSEPPASEPPEVGPLELQPLERARTEPEIAIEESTPERADVEPRELPPLDFVLTESERAVGRKTPRRADTQPSPAGAAIASQPISPESKPAPNTGKKWTPEFLTEVKEFRAKNGTKATAETYGVSTARVREKLPKEARKPKGHSVFTHHPK